MRDFENIPKYEIIQEINYFIKEITLSRLDCFFKL